MTCRWLTSRQGTAQAKLAVPDWTAGQRQEQGCNAASTASLLGGPWLLVLLHAWWERGSRWSRHSTARQLSVRLLMAGCTHCKRSPHGQAIASSQALAVARPM